MDIRRRVGQNVRKYREQRDWSQEELAFECDLHRTYISGVERGVRNPTVIVLQKIAKALKVPTALLLNESSRK
jgi:transcriptional regulator with XRE-family HTH domain